MGESICIAIVLGLAISKSTTSHTATMHAHVMPHATQKVSFCLSQTKPPRAPSNQRQPAVWGWREQARVPAPRSSPTPFLYSRRQTVYGTLTCEIGGFQDWSQEPWFLVHILTPTSHVLLDNPLELSRL